MKVAIVTDSNSGITQEEAKQLGITVIPMPFLINGEEYFEDISLNQEDFYKKLFEDADVSTSQPSIYNINKVWTDLLKSYDQIVHIPMSSGLSASCATATASSESDEFKGKVFVVDNKRISITQKQSVLDAIKLAKEGKTGSEIKDFLLETSMKASIYIMVSTLKYLKKGGRLTPAVAAIGSLLKIKPVLQIQGDKLDKFSQVMNVSVGKKRMIEQIIKDIETRFQDELNSKHLTVFMAYTYDKQKCLEFKAEAEKALEKYNIKIEVVDPLSLSVSCHIGENAIAIACSYAY